MQCVATSASAPRSRSAQRVAETDGISATANPTADADADARSDGARADAARIAVSVYEASANSLDVAVFAVRSVVATKAADTTGVKGSASADRSL